MDFQILEQEFDKSGIGEVKESPLEINEEMISSLSIDDCQLFYASSLETLFEDFYKGGSIRPLIFAGNS